MDFFTHFTREKTPQINFSCQNFSVENTLLISDMRAYGIVAMIMLALSVVFDLIAVFGTAKVKSEQGPITFFVIYDHSRYFYHNVIYDHSRSLCQNPQRSDHDHDRRSFCRSCLSEV